MSKKQKPEVRSQESEIANAAPQRDYDKLITLLKSEPTLVDKLIEALGCQRFFITVTFQKKYKPDDASDMHHTWFHKGIDSNDALKSLRHINNDYIAKNVPLAKMADGDGWH